jgi:8-oxo-dGTP diphosphatase
MENTIHLNEHKAAKWLTKDEWDNVNWLPADKQIIEKLKSQ